MRKKVRKARERAKTVTPPPGRNVDGTPTVDNPTFSLAVPGAAPIGVPNFFIDKFRIPPFLLPIYQAAGIQYGIRWEVLAAINEIETDYGRNLNISSAGAVGWMQFMPATWKMYGVDANKDGKRDPFNPVDAIFAAARYLKAAGGDTGRPPRDLRLQPRRLVRRLRAPARAGDRRPAERTSSARSPASPRAASPSHAKATYADDLSERDLKRNKGRATRPSSSSRAASAAGSRSSPRTSAPVIAVNDGQIVDIGTSKRLGNFIKLQDVYGNTYTYGHLKSVARRYPAPKNQKITKAAGQARGPGRGAEGRRADPGRLRRQGAGRARAEEVDGEEGRHAGREAGQPQEGPQGLRRKAAKQRLFANPRRPRSAEAGGAEQEFERTGKIDGSTTFDSYLSRVFGLDRSQVRLKRLKVGSKVIAGTILGRIGRTRQTRRRTCCSRSARPAAAPRGSTRSRSWTAGSCSSRPRSTAPRARTRSSAATPTPRRSARSC